MMASSTPSASAPAFPCRLSAISMRTQQVVFFTWTDPELATIRKSLPEFSEARIPKGTYKQQTDDQKTVGLFNFSIANKDMSDDLAYTITKTILENNAAMVQRPPRGQGDDRGQRHRATPSCPSIPARCATTRKKGSSSTPEHCRSNLRGVSTQSRTSAVIPTACTGRRFSKRRSVPSTTARSTTSGTPTTSRSRWPGSRTAACSPRSRTSS